MDNQGASKNPRNFTVLIAAGGKGARLSLDTPKQYLKIHGKSVLRYSAETFLNHPACTGVWVIIDPQDALSCHEALLNLSLPAPIHGGATRQASVFNGLKALSHCQDDDIVLIHDAARPCLCTRDIDNLLSIFDTHRAASLAVPVSATLRKVNDMNEAQENVERENLWALQTPQAFMFGDLKRAHEAADPFKTYTDDTALVSALGIPVKLVQSSPKNIKITYEDDLDMAEKFLFPAMITVTGQGFDVHGFDLAKSGPVRLCGVDIPHDRALKGHSDADVGLHALTDAVLGTIGAGDIGTHFPPSNPDFKGVDSAVFLTHALDLLRAAGGKLIHLDLTLICESPKIAPHATAMRTRLSALTGLSLPRISIKATTTEGLGFTGRKEGIAAQALVTVQIPEGTAL